MTSYPKVFIVILNHNGKDIIKNCLKSVFKINYPNFETVVVDNGSTDGSLESIKAGFSKVHFIKNEVNLGFSAGNNVGIRFALEKMADFVLLLSPTIEVEPDFLAELVRISMTDKKIGLSSPLIFKNRTKEIWFAGGNVDWFKMKAHHDDIRKQHLGEYFETGFASGRVMLVRKDVFAASGLLDEDFFAYWEDVDFSIRVQKAGFKTVVVPSSTIYNFEKSAEHEANKLYWLVLSELIFFKKNTAFPKTIWISTYVALCRLKNYLDLNFKKNTLNKVVRKAYCDFDKFSN